MKLRTFIATLAVVGPVAAGSGDDDNDDAAPDPAAETTETGDDMAEIRDDAAEGSAPP